jgi:cytochrome P450
MAEIHIILATIFRRFDLQLVETQLEDIQFDRDLMVPVPRKGHRNVKVVVKGTRLW